MMREMDNAGKENAREKSCKKLYGGGGSAGQKNVAQKYGKMRERKMRHGHNKCGAEKCEKAKYGRKLQG